MNLRENYEGRLMPEEVGRPDVATGGEDGAFARYQKSGGIIDEQEYQRVRAEAETRRGEDKSQISQIEGMAQYVGIDLTSPENGVDPVSLYQTLRSDEKNWRKYHAGEFGDQYVFAEVLRIVGDTQSLEKLKAAYSNIFLEGKLE